MEKTRKIKLEEIQYTYQFRGKYIHDLIISDHINELYYKHKYFTSIDKKAFKNESFIKELADLYILLKLKKDLDKSFSNIINNRIDHMHDKIIKDYEKIHKGIKND